MPYPEACRPAQSTKAFGCAARRGRQEGASRLRYVGGTGGSNSLGAAAVFLYGSRAFHVTPVPLGGPAGPHGQTVPVQRKKSIIHQSHVFGVMSIGPT